jgi:hypothetical protein
MKHGHTPTIPAEEAPSNSKSHILANPTQPFEPAGVIDFGSMVTCHSDSTIAVPIVVFALLEQKQLVSYRKRPSFKMGRELEVIV